MRKLWLIPLLALVMSACGGAAAPSATPAASAAASVAASAAPATAKPAPAKIAVGFSEIYQGALPMWYAASSGIFAKNGLDVTLNFTASSTGVAALLSNSIQLFMGGGSEVLSAAVGGEDLVLVGNLVPIYPYVFEVPAAIKTVDDLKGKQVGASSAGSTSDIATRVGLKALGIDPDKDVHIQYVGSSQNRTAALLAGSIQGGLDQPPGSLVLEAKGFHPLFNMVDQKLPVVNNGITVKRSYMTSNRDIVQRYVDSIVQSIAALRKDKPGGVAVLKKEMKIETDKDAEATYDFSMRVFPDLPYAKAEALSDSVNVLSAKNPTVKSYDLSKLLDESFVKSAADRGLNKP